MVTQANLPTGGATRYDYDLARMCTKFECTRLQLGLVGEYEGDVGE